jgi:hypothetical protein
MKNILILLAICSSLFFGACKKDATEDPVDFKKDYFPIEKGCWIDYQVDSIQWVNLGTIKIDTFHYKMRLKVDTTMLDNTGRIVHKLLKYINKDSLGWQVTGVATVLQTETGLEKFEDNNKYLKLAWPVVKGSKWNVNVYNSFDEILAKYSGVDEAKVIGNKSFTNCATVLLESFTTLIGVDFDEEIYAKGLGLVQRKTTHVETSTSGVIKNGYKYSCVYLTNGKD